MRLAPLALLLSATPLIAQTRAMPFQPGMVVTRSVKILPGVYHAPGTDSGVLIVRGNDITVDLRGVELVGTASRERPDAFAGTAIRVDGGSGVSVIGATIRGYKVGIIARGVRRLRLVDNDLSYNWKPRLYSTIEKESLVDWLSYHQNEKDEWLRYGAAIYLDDVDGGELRGNTARQGMNGLLLARSSHLKIWNNDFSFNSGLGVGMYRSSDNVVMHNRINFNVRGYSHGFFNRGQDSAGLLMYEQSCRNVVAYNSVTHSGDGLFLWAGQSTMDSGQGGSNDNIFYGNDFSFAPTNGMEATFSRNAFVANRVEGNWHGLWGGYSFGSTIMGNQFIRNVEGIAIEHGQDNRITGNLFEQDTTAIRLWWNKVEPSDWGYPKYRETSSRDYVILGNTFRGVRMALRIDNTQYARASGNAFFDVDSAVRLTGDSSRSAVGRDGAVAVPIEVPERFRILPLAGGTRAVAAPSARPGRDAIIVDAWGPYDGKSPRLWPVGRSTTVPQRLRVLGPAGTWRVVARDGVASLSADTGKMGDTLVVTPTVGREHDYRVELEYRGGRVVLPTGERYAAGASVPFAWTYYQPVATWRLRWVAWDTARVSRTDSAAIAMALATPAAVTLDTTRLDLTWFTPPRRTIQQARLLTEAVADVELAPGRYLLRAIADDGVKVYLDGRLLLDDWVAGESRVKEASFTAGGRHRLRVVHFQVDGWYELRVDIERAR